MSDLGKYRLECYTPSAVDRSACVVKFTPATWAEHQAVCGPCGVPFWQLEDAS